VTFLLLSTVNVPHLNQSQLDVLILLLKRYPFPVEVFVGSVSTVEFTIASERKKLASRCVTRITSSLLPRNFFSRCHEGSCGACAVACPCGKQQVECTGSSSRGGWEKSCGEACLRMLECNDHKCQQKCHQGSCGECLELKKRRCRCGAYENEVQCSKEFVCTTRCGKLKNCGLHTCNKKVIS